MRFLQAFLSPGWELGLSGWREARGEGGDIRAVFQAIRRVSARKGHLGSGQELCSLEEDHVVNKSSHL